MAENYKLKDFFDVQLVEQIAEAIHSVWPLFPIKRFSSQIEKRLYSLELKDRAALIAASLYEHLPQSYPEALHIIVQAMELGPGKDPEASMSAFYYYPYSIYVSEYGLGHFDLSMKALYQITKRFTSEFAIRPFLVKYPQETVKVLEGWINDPDEHVRRLVSEGTRPRLPWAMRLPQFQKDPRPGLGLLEKLKMDPSKYVRLSVANHLNDISKDHPELVVKTCNRWILEEGEAVHALCTHALRGLVKAGNPGAMKALGFTHDIDVIAEIVSCNAEVHMGAFLVFDVKVSSLEDKPTTVVIEYVIHYLKANDKHHPKIFRLTKIKLAPRETKTFTRRRQFVDFTTRKHYPGTHFLEIQINGKRFAKRAFKVLL